MTILFPILKFLKIHNTNCLQATNLNDRFCFVAFSSLKIPLLKNEVWLDIFRHSPIKTNFNKIRRLNDLNDAVHTFCVEL